MCVLVCAIFVPFTLSLPLVSHSTVSHQSKYTKMYTAHSNFGWSAFLYYLCYGCFWYIKYGIQFQRLECFLFSYSVFVPLRCRYVLFHFGYTAIFMYYFSISSLENTIQIYTFINLVLWMNRCEWVSKAEALPVASPKPWPVPSTIRKENQIEG